MVDFFKGGEKFVSAIQRNLGSYRVNCCRVVLIWENFKTCLSVCKKDNKVSRGIRVGQDINTNRTQQKPQKPTEQSIGVFILALIGFSFSFQTMDDMALEMVWKAWLCHQRLWPTSILPPSTFQKLVFFQKEIEKKWACQDLMMQKTIRKTCLNVIVCILQGKYKKAKRDLKDHL